MLGEILREELVKLVNLNRKNYQYTKKVEDDRFGEISIFVNKQDRTKKIMVKSNSLKTESEHISSIIQARERMQINHPCILRMMDYESQLPTFANQNEFTISAFYEYPNSNLREEIDQRMITGKSFKKIYLLNLAEDILSAISFLKKNKRIHGDIRPEYINWRKKKNQSQLLDRLKDSRDQFNVQKDHLDLNHNLYTSPQLLRNISGSVEIDDKYKSELFSLGLIILEAGILKSIQEIYDKESHDLNTEQFLNFIEEFLKKYQGEVMKKLMTSLLYLEEEYRSTPKAILISLRADRAKMKQRKMMELVAESEIETETENDLNKSLENFRSHQNNDILDQVEQLEEKQIDEEQKRLLESNFNSKVMDLVAQESNRENEIDADRKNLLESEYQDNLSDHQLKNEDSSKILLIKGSVSSRKMKQLASDKIKQLEQSELKRDLDDGLDLEKMASNYKNDKKREIFKQAIKISNFQVNSKNDDKGVEKIEEVKAEIKPEVVQVKKVEIKPEVVQVNCVTKNSLKEYYLPRMRDSRRDCLVYTIKKNPRNNSRTIYVRKNRDKSLFKNKNQKIKKPEKKRASLFAREPINKLLEKKYKKLQLREKLSDFEVYRVLDEKSYDPSKTHKIYRWLSRKSQ